MTTLLKQIFISLRWQDYVDFMLVTYLIYRVFTLINGTRAVQILIGLSTITIFYYLSNTLELYTLHWILHNFLSPIVLVIIILFQEDIRRALSNVGRNLFSTQKIIAAEQERSIIEIAKALDLLSNAKLGALIVLERKIGLSNYIEGGIQIDAKLSADLLYSIFNPASPLHDGAVIIRNNKIISAASLLPLSLKTNIPKPYGTRHRAGVGVTEETDSIAIIASEETGSISFAKDGKLYSNIPKEKLQQLLIRNLTPEEQ